MRNPKGRFIIIICSIVVLTLSCSRPVLTRTTPEAPDAGGGDGQPEPTSLPGETPQTPEGIILDASQVYTGKFNEYQQTAVSLPQQFAGGYTLPLDPSQVEDLSELDLTRSQLALLIQNGFVIEAPPADPDEMLTEFYQGYEKTRYGDFPVFITTDAVFHVYHLVFDKMLRDLERDAFIPILKELTSTMIAATLDQYNQLKGTPLQEAAARNVAYFSVAGQLLQTGDALLPITAELVGREMELINQAAGADFSPIWTYYGQPADLKLIEDYSQYIPRGHYTLSEDLQMYFKAMMWYGRMTFRLVDPMEVQRALLVTQALRNAQTFSGGSALRLWQNIYDPTVFIVGKADDLGVYEIGAVSDAVYGPNPDPALFGDEALMQTFLATARNLPPPQVNSMWVWIWQDQDQVTQGFRFMGQRFTLDQYVFGQLMWRNVGTLEKPRDLPKALDFFAAQGSDLALQLLKDMGEDQYANFDSQMAKVTQEVAQLGVDSWTQNLYWSWLYALQPVFAEKGAAYPPFMQTDAWARKDLQTALSSWTELKHDTILYSKQVMAEMGGGPGDEPPHGYVEPNPEAYARLLALAQMTYSGLESRQLLGLTTQYNLTELIDELQFLLDISQKELASGAITSDDYYRMMYFGGWLETMTVASADAEEAGSYRGYLEDQKSALVADVATGMNRVLEEGVGYPTHIYVVAPDQPYRVTVGVVYSYYEFVVDPGQRMTDETWQQWLESGQAPAQPEWVTSFSVR
jgi:hypothetical protein